MTTFPIHLLLTPKNSTEENRFRFVTFHTEKSIREFISQDIKIHSQKDLYNKNDSLSIVMGQYIKICVSDGWGCMEIIDGSGSRWCEEITENEVNELIVDSEWEHEWDDDEYVHENFGRSLREQTEESKEDSNTELFDDHENLDLCKNRVTELNIKGSIILSTQTPVLHTYQKKKVYKSLTQVYRDLVDDIYDKMKTNDDYRREVIENNTLHLTSARMLLTKFGYQTDLERNSPDRRILHIYTYRA